MTNTAFNQLRLLLGLGLLAMSGFSATFAQDQPAERPEPADAAAETDADEAASEAESNEEELPLLEEMELPSAEQLLRGPRLDWIVLKRDQQVIVVEPVTPRPETLVKMQTAIDEKMKERKNLSGEALIKHRDEVEAMGFLRLRLPDQLEEADFLLAMKLVEQIIHHEDLVLRRIDELIKEKNFDLAYELLNILRRNTPNWPGALDRHNALLLAEASRKVEKGQYESALATLEEIYSRSPQFAGLPERTGSVIDRLIERAIENDDWRKARHFRRRLATMYNDHPSVETWRSRFESAAETELAAADEARRQGDHREALTHAEKVALIWPATRNLRARYRTFADRYQRLHVGVLDLPSRQKTRAVVKSHADERAAGLSEIRFFEVDHADDGSAHYNTRFCDRWEPLNLGREVEFDLRRSRQPWEGQPVVTAPLIASKLASRLDPSHPQYDERLAGYVESVNVRSPYSFTVRFDRVPVRTEALLALPVIEADTEVGNTPSDEGTSTVSVSSHGETANSLEKPIGGFQLTERTAERAVYERALPEPDDLRLFHLTEIEERLYPDAAAALQGLIRGEVSMLVRPPARIVELLRSDEEMLKAFFVEKMAVPVTHVVQFHPRSQSLKNREFRRALAYAIDRQQILSETVLQTKSEEWGRVVNGPLPSRSDANNALVRTRSYDPLAAISLSLAARKQLGGTLPTLRMLVIDDAIAQQAATELVESWARFGIEVEVADLPDGPLMSTESDAAEWDLLYRTVQLTEPVTQLWPFLTLSSRARVADLDPFPDWLRQEIIELDLASDWRAALQTVNTLHLHLWGEVMLLPLWEVDEYLIYRKNVRGVPVSPVHPYEEADRWVVESWYPEDAP